MDKNNRIAWNIAKNIHRLKIDLIDQQKQLEDMGYTLHFNKNDQGEYEPILYKKFTNCIRKVKIP